MRRKILFILIMGILHIFLAAYLLAKPAGDSISEGAKEHFAYDSKGKRDPFVPLVTQKVRISAAGLESVEGPGDIILEGIVWDSYSDSIAILNGVIMKEGQQVASVKIKKIEEKSVTLLINEIEYKIDLIKKGEETGEEF